jgi:hypothetical protein
MIDRIKNFFLPRHNVAEIIKPTARLDGWKAYQGAFPDPIRATRTDPENDDVTVIPLIAQIVDTSVAHLFGRGRENRCRGEDAAHRVSGPISTTFAASHRDPKGAMNAAVTGQPFSRS